jgi:hypothetical protein
VSEQKVIEILVLHGGPCDGERHNGAEPVEVLRVQTQAGETAIYRRSGEYEQLRGTGMAEPFSRLWSYEWAPRP